MPRTLIHGEDDADEGDQVLQYRGPESTVVAEPAGMDGVRLVFSTIQQFGGAYQKPYPVVADDADDPPDDAILASIAERLVETSPVLHYGAACPDCDGVFETLEGATSHYGIKHGEQSDADAETDDEGGND